MPNVLTPLSEDLIREADGLFLGLLRNALVGVYIIQDDLFRYVSPRFAEILGRSQEEICLQLGPDDLIDARDRETMRRAVADRIEAEAGHDLVLVVQWQDLAQQRVAGVAVAHARDETARHPQRELRRGLDRELGHAAAQAQQCQQFGRVAHGVAPEAFPIPAGGGLQGGGGCGYH